MDPRLLGGAQLQGAHFDGADLRGASFAGAKLGHARFDRADMQALARGGVRAVNLDGASHVEGCFQAALCS